MDVLSVPSVKQEPSNSKPHWTPEALSEGGCAAHTKSHTKLPDKQSLHQPSLACSASEGSRSVSVLDLPHPILGHKDLQYEMMDYDQLQQTHVSWMLGGPIPARSPESLPSTQQPTDLSTPSNTPHSAKIILANKRDQAMLTQQLGSEHATESVPAAMPGRIIVGFNVKEVEDRLSLIQLCHENRALLLRVPSYNDGLGKNRPRDDISSPPEQLCVVDSGGSSAIRASKGHRTGHSSSQSRHNQQRQQQRLSEQRFPARTALASLLQSEHHIATAGLMIPRYALLVASRLGVITNHGIDLAAGSAKSTGVGPIKPQNLYNLFQRETGITLPLVQRHSHEWDSEILSGEQVRVAVMEAFLAWGLASQRGAKLAKTRPLNMLALEPWVLRRCVELQRHVTCLKREFLQWMFRQPALERILLMYVL